MTTNLDQVVFDATLRPNPPLSVPVLKAIVAVVAVINLAFAVTFLLKGAWPVTPFMGADVALLAWAFRAARIAARRHERVTLRPASLTLERHPAKGTPSEVVFNPYWVRVDMDDPPNHWSKLTLRSHGRVEQVGSFLAPQDRQSFAGSLKDALHKLRETPA
jgi:uncharacterized membrane protein